MLSHKKLTLSRLALAASLTASLAWAGTSSGTVQCGSASGSIYGPALSSIGAIDGTLTDASGASYRCVGTLEPRLDNPPLWTGFSSTGIVDGTLTPIGSGATGIRFWGAYGMDKEGRGSFQAFLTTPPSPQGIPSDLVGSFTGRFHDAATLNQVTLLPVPGEFRGQWNLDL